MELAYAPALTSKQKYQRRLAALKSERGTWDPHWRELSDYIQPRRSRFLSTDINRGSEKNDEIINGTATWAVRVLASGMMAGITSPARDWFRLITPDQDLSESDAVKSWLQTVEDRIKLVFQRSNIYNSLHTLYGDLAWAGTGALHVEEDLEDGIRSFVYPLGSFALANSARLRVDTIYREFGMTVAQLVEEFGEDKCSAHVQSMYRNGNYDAWVQVVHAIEPNRERKRSPGTVGYQSMLVKSCYYERDNADINLLREGGYEEFPAMCPRWTVTGEDVYGSSPAMDALGDVRALQELERKAGQAFDKIVNPPLMAPMSMQFQAVSLLPAAVNYVEHAAPANAFRSIYDVNPAAITVVQNKIREHEMRIKTALYADLFLMLAQSEGNMTAREVAERHEEKMLQLGPVMERLQDELLDPLIKRTFGILFRAHYLPPPPPEMQGKSQSIRIEYVSTMAQAQKMIGSGSIERTASFIGNLAGVNPDILDVLNFDEIGYEYADMNGVRTDCLRTPDEVAKIRAQRQQAKAQAQQTQAALQQAQGAKLLSQADMSGDNALTRAAEQFGGPAAGGGG